MATPDPWLVALRTSVIFSVLLAALFPLRSASEPSPGSWQRWTLLVCVLVSAALGFDYVLFQLPPALRAAEASGSITVHHYYGLSAGAIFAVAQCVASYHLVRDDARYLAWLLPAAAYLFAIGLFGWLRFGLVVMVFADTLRAVILVELALLHERSRARRPQATMA